ncbi:iron permease FTR1 [Mycena polygramma]|nr:iron permease FTR1 [Mycena polygramma]
MGKNLFSVPIFFIVFRETLEAAIIVSVLLGLAEQIVYEDPARFGQRHAIAGSNGSSNSKEDVTTRASDPEDDTAHRRQLIRKLRIQGRLIFAGAGLGLFFALAIGAAFIALEKAFSGARTDNGTRAGRWVLFILPLITVLREGRYPRRRCLSWTARDLDPIATIVGLICGLVVGFIIYTFASCTTLTVFLVLMTNLLLLIGAGLFSRAVWAFEEHAFNKLLGGDVDDSGGDGPGSFRVSNSDNLDGQGWIIFNAIFGWTNSATLGSVLSYVFYWIAVIVTLVVMKHREGHSKLFGRESAAGRRRRAAREAAAERPVGEEK